MAYSVYFLTFADTRGLDSGSFNTIRLGLGWAKKLKVGDRVLLAHKDQIVGDAEVYLIDAGPKMLILEKHAWKNHIELALRDEEGKSYNFLQAPARRLASMFKNYGPRAVDGTKSATVVYLRKTRTHSQMMRDAGYTRRPSAKSLPSDE